MDGPQQRGCKLGELHQLGCPAEASLGDGSKIRKGSYVKDWDESPLVGSKAKTLERNLGNFASQTSG